jgi:hypothetical protein
VQWVIGRNAAGGRIFYHKPIEKSAGLKLVASFPNTTSSLLFAVSITADGF